MEKMKKKIVTVSILVMALLAALLIGAAFVHIGLFFAVLAVYAVLALGMMIRLGKGYFGPLKELAVNEIAKTYDAASRKGEIVFYGASNFTFWKTMEEDLAQYRVQNHGFGGSDDAGLIRYADKILYPYEPKIVVFQTGSNDYVHVPGSDEEKIAFCMERKREMFAMFHKRLPDAKFLVMAGILLPGRKEYLELTREINRQLKALCRELPYLTYVDAEDMTYRDGVFDESLFVPDKIHLTPEARIRWAKEYIIPALEQVITENGLDEVRKE